MMTGLDVEQVAASQQVFGRPRAILIGLWWELEVGLMRGPRGCVLVCFGVCVCGVGAFFVDIRVFVILIETFLCQYYFG